jgi:hypothetical protein
MKIKNLSVVVLVCALVVLMASCKKEEIVIDLNLPAGTFTASKSGSIVAQNDTGSKGTVSLGTDESGTTFVKFDSDFSTVLATGTLTVYLSTSDTYIADPGNGNPNLKLIGIVSKNGEQYFKLDSPAGSQFTHVILWCGSASIPFGYSPLQ